MRGQWRESSLGPQDRAMLAYVEKLTIEPWEIEEADVQALRGAGFSDAAITDIALQAGLFALINRAVDGLGGHLEPGMASEADRLGYPLHPGAFDEADLD